VSLDDARAFVARLSHGREDRLVHLAELPPREAVVAPWPAWLPSDVREAYARRGIAAPWSHQVQAAEGLYAGRHVAIATGTASGKSLAFGMPALAAIEAGTRSPDGRGAVVLYLAPTKALANDQLRALDELDLGWLRAATYDGDTVPEERAWVRRHANLVLSNPDLLHHSALPGHEHWATSPVRRRRRGAHVPRRPGSTCRARPASAAAALRALRIVTDVGDRIRHARRPGRQRGAPHRRRGRAGH
jgi:ATP-dependent helicase YprA (DUF1998 family)